MAIYKISCIFLQQFSVSQIEYPLGDSSKKGSYACFLLIIAMVLLLWCQIVLFWHQVTTCGSIRTMFISNNTCSTIWQNNTLTQKNYLAKLNSYVTVKYCLNRWHCIWLVSPDGPFGHCSHNFRLTYFTFSLRASPLGHWSHNFSLTYFTFSLRTGPLGHWSHNFR